MKTSLLTLFSFILVLSVSAQKKVTDREFDGLKGNVKSVTTDEKVSVSWSNRQDVFYDKNGSLIKRSSIFNQYPISRLIFREAGYLSHRNSKTFFVYSTICEKPLKNTRVQSNLPIEESVAKVPPDNCFHGEFAYDYTNGRVEIERRYAAKDKILYQLTTFKYDIEGRLVEENIKEVLGITKVIHKYDAKGNLVETTQSSKEYDNEGNSVENNKSYKTIHSDYKFDDYGNWIARKSTQYSIEAGKSSVLGVKEISRKITYF